MANETTGDGCEQLVSIFLERYHTRKPARESKRERVDRRTATSNPHPLKQIKSPHCQGISKKNVKSLPARSIVQLVLSVLDTLLPSSSHIFFTTYLPSILSPTLFIPARIKITRKSYHDDGQSNASSTSASCSTDDDESADRHQSDSTTTTTE